MELSQSSDFKQMSPSQKQAIILANLFDNDYSLLTRIPVGPLIQILEIPTDLEQTLNPDWIDFKTEVFDPHKIAIPLEQILAKYVVNPV